MNSTMSNNIPLSDLRIGNYVQRIEDKHIFIISSLVPGYSPIVRNLEGKLMPGDFYEGIPITEEWLKANGFKRTMWADCKNGYNIDDVIYFDFDTKSFGAFDCGQIRFSKECKFIHDFQNCFYFLTGTELTLNK